VTPTIASSKRVFEIDVLRGVAVLLVLGFHGPASPILSRIGYSGVDLFFVLSGFLISNLLFQEYQKQDTIRLSRFFLRRAMKLYPSFYLLIGLSVIYCLIWHSPLSERKLLGELFFVQNYLGSMWGHTWSLAVEEHFYIFLPLMLALMLKFHKTADNPFWAIPYLFLGLAVGCLGLRLLTAHYHFIAGQASRIQPSGPDWILAPNSDFGVFRFLLFGTGDSYTGLRCDSLFFGVFLGYFHNFRPQILSKLMSFPWRFLVSLVGILCLAPLAFFSLDSQFTRTVGFTLLYIGFGTMLMLAIYKEPGRKVVEAGMFARGIALIGVYSYTIYLWHFPLIVLFQPVARHWITNEYALFAIYFAASILVGVVVAKLIEIPILKLRDRMDSTRMDSTVTHQRKPEKLTSLRPIQCDSRDPCSTR
jgi:peptidoglycan/LPS O-acetylase OafA/YrhL